MLRSVSAIWAKQLHNNGKTTIALHPGDQTFRLSDQIWRAFDRPLPPKVLRQMAMCRCPAWFLFKTKRRLYKTKVSETSMVVQVGLFVEGSATVRTLEFWGKQIPPHTATNPNQQPYTKIIWDVRHFTMSDSMTFPPEARLAALSCFCISAACRHDKWQVHFTWSTNDFRFGTRVAWLAQERCIEFDEEISGAQVLPGPTTICIAKRAFFAASGSPEAPWPEWKSCAFHLRSHPVSKPTFAARIAWRKAKDLTNQIEWSNRKDKKTSNHIKTYTLLQFVLISWDNQLRFPFWDRTFLLKAKCTAVGLS